MCFECWCQCWQVGWCWFKFVCWGYVVGWLFVFECVWFVYVFFDVGDEIWCCEYFGDDLVIIGIDVGDYFFFWEWFVYVVGLGFVDEQVMVFFEGIFEVDVVQFDVGFVGVEVFQFVFVGDVDFVCDYVFVQGWVDQVVMIVDVDDEVYVIECVGMQVMFVNGK